MVDVEKLRREFLAHTFGKLGGDLTEILDNYGRYLLCRNLLGGVPDGYVLVPKEPTEHQVKKGAQSVSCLSHEGARAVYAAMVTE